MTPNAGSLGAAMKTILVTGSQGFMGRNLVTALERAGKYSVLKFGREQSVHDLDGLTARADLVFHLAGVNRPREEREFTEGNLELTRSLCRSLEASGRSSPLVLSSSIQAELDNPYGRSKRGSEDVAEEHQRRTGAPVYIFRFPNVFGKWSRPNYNTVVATFCYNISRGRSVRVDNPDSVVRLVYIDDVVEGFLEIAAREEHDPGVRRPEVRPIFEITVGQLRALIVALEEDRRKGLLPDLSEPLAKYIYSTYLSFLDSEDFAYPVELRIDNRGWLFEWVKSPHAGQIFVSRTLPGITRGNHYHDTKVEKFCVVQGKGVIRLRHMVTGEAAEYALGGQDIQVVDIPPGYAHSIENVGEEDMITLFWANEIFDHHRPDTFPEAVIPAARGALR
jgi:UDP-2-acetamido-2,6-beta-L-arabino-hexul-4-ose reductase